MTDSNEDTGEEIFADDGLAPVGVSKPPIVQQQAAGDSSSEAVLSSEQMSPQAAFEIFQGKVYSASVPTNTKNHEHHLLLLHRRGRRRRDARFDGKCARGDAGPRHGVGGEGWLRGGDEEWDQHGGAARPDDPPLPSSAKLILRATPTRCYHFWCPAMHAHRSQYSAP